MRFTSFVRLPKYKRFDITPRYYDPIKEELAERTERIKAEMNGEDPGYVPSRITFERKVKPIPSASFLQITIAAVLGLGLVGWMYLGNDILYALWAIVPVYLFFRLRKMRRG
ncbi:MAG: hypothetical protein JXR03_00245 [Cyclobacteriaceae bacterium]